MKQKSFSYYKRNSFVSSRSIRSFTTNRYINTKDDTERNKSSIYGSESLPDVTKNGNHSLGKPFCLFFCFQFDKKKI